MKIILTRKTNWAFSIQQAARSKETKRKRSSGTKKLPSMEVLQECSTWGLVITTAMAQTSTIPWLMLGSLWQKKQAVEVGQTRWQDLIVNTSPELFRTE